MGSSESRSFVVQGFFDKWQLFNPAYHIETEIEMIFSDKAKCLSFINELKTLYEATFRRGCGFITHKCICPRKIIKRLNELK